MALIKMERTNKATGEVTRHSAGWTQEQAEEKIRQEREAHGDEFTFKLIGVRPGKSAANEQTAVAMGAQKEMGGMTHDGMMYRGYCPGCGEYFEDYCETCD